MGGVKVQNMHFWCFMKMSKFTRFLGWPNGPKIRGRRTKNDFKCWAPPPSLPPCTFDVLGKCQNLRTFWDDQMDPKSAVGGPKTISRAGPLPPPSPHDLCVAPIISNHFRQYLFWVCSHNNFRNSIWHSYEQQTYELIGYFCHWRHYCRICNSKQIAQGSEWIRCGSLSWSCFYSPCHSFCKWTSPFESSFQYTPPRQPDLWIID